jgi:bacteriocin-like protein
MLMKYKDFKTMTQAEMKKIVGGNEEEELDSCGTCPSSSGGGVKLTCTKSYGMCLKPANCNNAVDCKVE